MDDIMNIYKSLNVKIGRVMKNPEMLYFFADRLETKKMCTHAVKNYLIY